MLCVGECPGSRRPLDVRQVVRHGVPGLVVPRAPTDPRPWPSDHLVPGERPPAATRVHPGHGLRRGHANRARQPVYDPRAWRCHLDGLAGRDGADSPRGCCPVWTGRPRETSPRDAIPRCRRQRPQQRSMNIHTMLFNIRCQLKPSGDYTLSTI